MKWVFKILGGFILAGICVFLLGYGTMYLWNWIMPYLFHLPEINFAMAIGMLLLSKLLFGGMRIRGGRWWAEKKYWKAKWQNMTPDEREKFKTEFAQRCRHKWGRVEVKVEKSE